MNKKIFKTLFTIFFIIIMFGFFKSNRCDFKTTRFLIAEWSLIYFIIVFYIDNIWMQLFLGWTLIRTALMINVGAFQYAYVSFNTMFFYCVAYQVFRDKIEHMSIDLKCILNILCIITLVHCFYMFMQNWGIWIITYPLEYGIVKAKYGIVEGNFRMNVFYILDYINSNHVHGFKDVIVGQLGQANLNGAYLAMTLPLFFRKKWCYGIPFVLMAIYLCQALGGIISALFVIGLFCWLYLKEYRGYLLCIMISSLIVYLKMSNEIESFLSGSGRFGIWNTIYKIVNENDWISGYGLGTFKLYSPQIMEKLKLPYVKYYQLHNEYLQCYFEAGLISVSILFGFCISVITKFLKSDHYLKTIIIIGIMVGLLNCGAIFLMHSTVAWLMLVYIAMLDNFNETRSVSWQSMKKNIRLWMTLTKE